MKKLVVAILFAAMIAVTGCGQASQGERTQAELAAPAASQSEQSVAAEEQASSAAAAAQNATLNGELGAKAAPSVDTLYEAMKSCTGFMGTAGTSLKAAVRARDLLDFCVGKSLKDVDQQQFRENQKEAYGKLSEEEQQDFSDSLEMMIAPLIEDSLKDYASEKPVFEDAGAENMEDLVKNEDAPLDWSVFWNGYQDMNKGI